MSYRHLETYEKVTIRIDHNSGMVYVDDYDGGGNLMSFRMVQE